MRTHSCMHAQTHTIWLGIETFGPFRTGFYSLAYTEELEQSWQRRCPITLDTETFTKSKIRGIFKEVPSIDGYHNTMKRFVKQKELARS